MSDTSKVLATKFTDDRFPIKWKDEGEKSLMWFYDDLHCPNPISPLYFDIGGWWDCDGRWGADCTYMYQRFGAPIGKAWIAKKIGGYVYSAVVPPETDADKVGPMFDYYTKVMPIYADTFMDRWKKEYVPRLQQMQARFWRGGAVRLAVMVPPLRPARTPECLPAGSPGRRRWPPAWRNGRPCPCCFSEWTGWPG